MKHHNMYLQFEWWYDNFFLWFRLVIVAHFLVLFRMLREDLCFKFLKMFGVLSCIVYEKKPTY